MPKEQCTPPCSALLKAVSAPRRVSTRDQCQLGADVAEVLPLDAGHVSPSLFFFLAFFFLSAGLSLLQCGALLACFGTNTCVDVFFASQPSFPAFWIRKKTLRLI